MHEVLHAMGFSAGLWRRQQRMTDLSYLLKPDGSGYLPYDGALSTPPHASPQCLAMALIVIAGHAVLCVCCDRLFT